MFILALVSQAKAGQAAVDSCTEAIRHDGGNAAVCTDENVAVVSFWKH